MNGLGGEGTARLPAATQGAAAQIVVLMVDDQAMLGETVRRMLAGEPDLRFHYCADPLQAQARVRELSPTVILQDLVMPGMDGLTLLDRYRADPASALVPVIMLSTREEPATKAQSFARGASDYVVKLPDRLELLARIRHHGGGYIARQQRDAAFRALGESERLLAAEVARSDALLLNIMPAKVAAELKRAGCVQAELHEDVCVMFTDFTGFTRVTGQYAPQELVAQLNQCFSEFDAIVGRHGLEKLKTIGDGYLCVGGLTERAPDAPGRMVAAAIEIRDYCGARRRVREAAGEPYWDVRVGIHVGPVVAGVVGVSRFAFDVWGDTVNLASRLEAASEPGRINVSGRVHQRIAARFRCQARGVLPVKNADSLEMYFVEAAL